MKRQFRLSSFVVIAMAVIMMCGQIVFADCSDSDFYFAITTGNYQDTATRIKHSSSSGYVKATTHSGPFVASLVGVTSQGYKVEYQKYYLNDNDPHQLINYVNEDGMGNACLRIRNQSTDELYIRGKWSPDYC